MDHGAPRWVFGASALFMVLVVVFALTSDLRSSGRLRPLLAVRRRTAPRRA
jgi:hypothetical protein